MEKRKNHIQTLHLNSLDLVTKILNSQILGVFAGAVLGFLGTFITMRLQVKYAGRIRTQELVAEKREQIIQEAYKRMKDLEAKVWQESPVGVGSALEEIKNQQHWFFYKQIYLPVEFGNKWMEIRSKLHQFNSLNTSQPVPVDRISQLDKEIVKLMKESLGVLYHEVGREPLKGEIEITD